MPQVPEECDKINEELKSLEEPLITPEEIDASLDALCKQKDNIPGIENVGLAELCLENLITRKIFYSSYDEGWFDFTDLYFFRWNSLEGRPEIAFFVNNFAKDQGNRRSLDGKEYAPHSGWRFGEVPIELTNKDLYRDDITQIALNDITIIMSSKSEKDFIDNMARTLSAKKGLNVKLITSTKSDSPVDLMLGFYSTSSSYAANQNDYETFKQKILQDYGIPNL